MENVDEQWMQEALAEAQKAWDAGEVPVGAVVVKDGVIIARAFNQPITTRNPVAHAEILALQAAAQVVGNYRLVDCDLYVTLEPCTMCAGALIHSRIRRLIYGATEPKAGAVQSMAQVLGQPWMNHRIDVTSGVLEAQCSSMLSAFFKQRRERIKQAKRERDAQNLRNNESS